MESEVEVSDVKKSVRQRWPWDSVEVGGKFPVTCKRLCAQIHVCRHNKNYPGKRFHVIPGGEEVFVERVA